MDLREYDVIVINSSGGKDSQAMLWRVHNLAAEQGVVSRLVVVHADLGRVEWAGTRELAERQAAILGLPFYAISRTRGDLLSQVEHERAKWPSSTRRYCTSDHKRDQISKIFTRLVRESGIKGRPVRLLNCMGLRADESSARALKAELAPNARASNTKRVVTDWLPVHGLSEAEVWQTISESPLPVHPAYAAGMPRLSCCFCVLASRGALVRAAQLNPELAQEYLGVERRLTARRDAGELAPGGTEILPKFRQDLSMAEIIEQAQANGAELVTAGNWCA